MATRIARAVTITHCTVNRRDTEPTNRTAMACKSGSKCPNFLWQRTASLDWSTRGNKCHAINNNQQPTNKIPGVAATPRWETIRQQAPCKSTPTRGGTDCTQPNSDGRSGKPRDKLGQRWPVMKFPCNRNSTTYNNQPQCPSNFIVQPYNAAVPSDCRSVLEDVIMGASVLTN
jgi:hypothetical protein